MSGSHESGEEEDGSPDVSELDGSVEDGESLESPGTSDEELGTFTYSTHLPFSQTRVTFSVLLQRLQEIGPCSSLH